MIEVNGPEAATQVNNLLAQSESARFESKRVSGKMVGKALETLCAFANTSGGTLALGLEDPLKAVGRDRLFGIGENPEAVDELRRKALTHLLPAVEGLRWMEIACKLRDGADGHLLLLQVPQSPKVHSILDNGTWTRLDASDREITATEITELSHRRGVISAESEPLPIALVLLDTPIWRLFVAQRGFLRGEVPNRLFPIGDAKRVEGELQPPLTAMLLFAEVRPPIWEQVSDWIDRHGALVNSDLRRIAGVDTLKASKMLKAWVEEGILRREESGGKRRTFYCKPNPDNESGVDLSLSLPLDNETQK